MTKVDISELRTRFSYYIRRVEAGEEFVVMRLGAPAAKLVGPDRPTAERVP
jgi:prevent-host-death family protein